MEQRRHVPSMLSQVMCVIHVFSLHDSQSPDIADCNSWHQNYLHSVSAHATLYFHFVAPKFSKRSALQSEFDGFPCRHGIGDNEVWCKQSHVWKKAQPGTSSRTQRQLLCCHWHDCQTDNHTAGVHVIRNDDVTNGIRSDPGEG